MGGDNGPACLSVRRLPSPLAARAARRRLVARALVETAPRPLSAGSLAALAASLVSQNLGAAIAKSLFPRVGVEGMTALRIGLSALLLLAFWRPWRRPVARRDVANVVAYGAMLGA